MTRRLVVFAAGGIPLITTATCDPHHGTFDFFRDDDHGSPGVFDFFVDDCAFGGCFFDDEILFFD